MEFALLLIATLLFAAPVFAEEYEKGPNGGQMLDVAGVDAEFLTAGNTVTINVFVPNAPSRFRQMASLQRCSSSAAVAARRFPLRLTERIR